MQKINAFCSICTLNYSVYAGVLNESLRKAGHQETHYVLVVDYDEKYRDVVDNFGFEPVFLFELAIPNVDELIEKYSAFELSNVLKPFFIEWLLKKHKKIAYLIYLDADIYVYSPLNEIFDYLEKNSKISIVITPHLSDHKVYVKTSDYSLERLFMLAGLYNGGFYAIKNDRNAMQFLDWQKIKVFNYGYNGQNAQMFVDQKILDFAPVLFEYVWVYRNEGYNVGHWNYNSNPVKKVSNTYFAGKKRLVFFHFSYLKINEIDIAKSFLFNLSLQDKPALQEITSNYWADLEKNGYDKIKDIPYGFQERYNEPPISLINPLWAKSIELEEMRGEFEKQAASSQQMIEHLTQTVGTREQALAEQARIHAEREKALATQIQSAQEEQRRIEQEGAAREKDLTKATEGLLRHVAQREKEFGEQMIAGQRELLNLEREWAQAEKTLNQEIAGLQSEIQALNHAQQLQAQQHGFELATKQDELNRLIQTCADSEARLKAQIRAIDEVEKNLAITHASLFWRLTAPFRQIASFIGPRKGPKHPFPSQGMAEPSPVIKPAVAESLPTEVQPTSKTSVEQIMPPAIQASLNLNAPPVAATLNELLACHDQAFIHCAYQTLLGRDPDEEGLNYYVGRLRTGIPKIQILGELRRSEEGRDYAANLPRLNAAIRRYRWAQKPIIGWLVRLSTGVEGNNATERKLRGLESQLFLLGEENMRRFDIEQIKAVVAAEGSTVQAGPAPSAPVPPIQPSDPEALKQISARARDIYFQLKTAA